MIRTHKWSNLWGIPGGKIKWGEPSEVALRREIKEETDLEVTNIEFALVQDCIHSKEFYRDAHFVLLNYICRAKSRRPVVTLNEEGREYRWLTPEKAWELPLNYPTKVLLEAVRRQHDAAGVVHESLRRVAARTRRETGTKRKAEVLRSGNQGKDHR